MRNKFIRAVAGWLAVLFLLAGILPVSASSDEAQGFFDDIIAYKLNGAGASTVQQWIDGTLADNAGTTSEWYIITLSQSGTYNFSTYREALLKYLSENEVHSASSRQKYALALIASGSMDSYIQDTLNDSIGGQGIMSWIYGLHLLNNGYQSNVYSVSSVKQTILSLQLSAGGWTVVGSAADVDVTAMAVQALAPHYKSDLAVKDAVDKALTLLSARQQAGGDYASHGISNPESTAQVLVALSALHIDCENDERFIKNGCTLFDGIGLYRLSDGSFCHQAGGDSNETATMQVFYAMAAYQRMKAGKSPLYVLDAQDPAGFEAVYLSEETSESAETSAESQEASFQETSSLAQVSQQPSGEVSDLQNNSEISEEETVSTVSSDTTKNVSEQAESSTSGEDSDMIVSETFILSESAESHESSDPASVSMPRQVKKPDYKVWSSVAVVVLSGTVCLILYSRKKRNAKNFAVILAAAVVGICFIWITDFQTTDSYYQSAGSEKKNTVGTVTMTIRCDTVAGREEHIPESGIILEATEFAIEANDTVFDILTEAAQKYKFHLETTGGDSVYVEGIGNIYEFDFGDLSGWIYRVNGTAPSVGCGNYLLKDSDEIEWLYTCNLGKDIE